MIFVYLLILGCFCVFQMAGVCDSSLKTKEEVTKCVEMAASCKKMLMYEEGDSVDVYMGKHMDQSPQPLEPLGDSSKENTPLTHLSTFRRIGDGPMPPKRLFTLASGEEACKSPEWEKPTPTIRLRKALATLSGSSEIKTESSAESKPSKTEEDRVDELSVSERKTPEISHIYTSESARAMTPASDRTPKSEPASSLKKTVGGSDKTPESYPISLGGRETVTGMDTQRFPMSSNLVMYSLDDEKRTPIGDGYYGSVSEWEGNTLIHFRKWRLDDTHSRVQILPTKNGVSLTYSQGRHVLDLFNKGLDQRMEDSQRYAGYKYNCHLGKHIYLAITSGHGKRFEIRKWRHNKAGHLRPTASYIQLCFADTAQMFKFLVDLDTADEDFRSAVPCHVSHGTLTEERSCYSCNPPVPRAIKHKHIA